MEIEEIRDKLLILDGKIEANDYILSKVEEGKTINDAISELNKEIINEQSRLTKELEGHGR